MISTLLRLLGVLVGVAVLMGCGERGDGGGRAQGPMRVVVTIPPLEGLVRPLLPPDAEVRVLMPPGTSEHGYEFTAADMAAVAKADLLLYVGLGLEPKIEEFVARRRPGQRVDLSFATAVAVMGSADDHDHDHAHHGHDEEDDHHHHGGVDPHLWLDPVMVERLVAPMRLAVETVQERRGALDDAERQRLEEAADLLHDEVHGLWEEGARMLGPLAGQAIVTHHAAWGRLADRYGLTVAAVIRPIETNEPTPAAITAAIEAVRSQGVKAIFVEPQFSSTAAERIAAATGVKIARLDPVGDGDWFALMRANFRSLAEALGEGAAGEPAQPAESPAESPR